MDLKSRLHKTLNRTDRTVLLLGAFVLASILLMAQHVARLQRELVEANALQAAALYADALTNFRVLYTSDVVARVQEQGLPVRHDYTEVPGSIPLPATLSMELGRKLGNDSGLKTRLYSPYPFPWRQDGGLRDDFEQLAWENLSKEPSKPFFRIEELEGKRVLRYATADILRKSCVDCHNTHHSTPKSNWEVGDLRGVLEVSYPLDRSELLAGTGVRHTALIMTILAGLSLLGFRVSARKIRRTSLQMAEQKAQEQIRLEAEARAHQTQKLEAIGVLAGGIAHELNTPIQYVGDNTEFLAKAFEELNPVLGSFSKLLDNSDLQSHQREIERAKLLAEETDIEFLSEEIPEALSQSLEGLERVTAIVRSMKEFSHQGSGEKTPVDINQLLESSARMSRNEWRYVAELQTEFCPDLPPLVADRSRLGQVFLNLVINASHALQEEFETRKEKGSLTLRTALKDEGVEIQIEDTGGGIPEEFQSRILEPFFTTKKVGRGTGQGLSICLSAVQKHRGTLHFETGPGGTCFIVWLPYSLA